MGEEKKGFCLAGGSTWPSPPPETVCCLIQYFHLIFQIFRFFRFFAFFRKIRSRFFDFFQKNSGFQSEDFYLKRYIFGYINGQKQDNPAPRRNQLWVHRDIFVEILVRKMNGFAGHSGFLIPEGCGVILLLTVNVTKYVPFEIKIFT